MFTGIVQATGTVRAVERGDDGLRLEIESALLADAAIGASVAVNGVCLTATAHVRTDRVRFDVSPETIARTTLGDLEAPATVNLERPLRAGDELGGHIVQGHVDGVADVASIERSEDGCRVAVTLPEDLLRYVVQKGSVTLDGVSLTVAGLSGRDVEVALIPHTLEVTTLSAWREGTRVNVEVDVLAKYVERLVDPWRDRAQGAARATLG